MSKIQKILSIKKILPDTQRKHLLRIFFEIIHCLFLEKELPFYYFENLLYKKDSPSYYNFIGAQKRGKIINDFYFREGINENLENKLKFSEILGENNIRTPKKIAYSDGLTIVTVNKTIKVTNVNVLREILKELVNISKDKSIFIKKVEGLGGFHAFKFDSEKKPPKEKLIELYKLMNKHDFIIQETIIQHHDLNLIYPNSINTLRVHTFKNGNDVEIISALIRFGGKNNIVDNISSGGCFVTVNHHKWKLGRIGREFFQHGGHQYLSHPDTNHKFEGTEIPFGNEVEELVKSASSLFDSEFIGWDVGITEDGPIIIEGNQNPHVFMLQMSEGGLKNNNKYNYIFGN